MPRHRSSPKNNCTANLGFEAKLERRGQAAQQYGCGGVQARRPRAHFPEIHLRCIRGTPGTLLAGKGDYAGADPEDPDEYKALNVFWVPPGARWTYLQNSAKQPEIGKIVDDAMVAIERDNPRLKGVLPKEYARPALDKHRLGELIDLIGTISFLPGSAGASPAGIGAPADSPSAAHHRSKDILGRVYEYFLGLSRYVGAEEVEDEGDPFEEKIPRPLTELEAQFAESAKLESAIPRHLARFDFKP